MAIKAYTGHSPDEWKGVPRLHAGRFVVDDRDVSGDAPKDFIRVHDGRGRVRLSAWRQWPGYIAKVGHKSYPAESVTEHLITRIGQVVGLNIADSRLMICANQLRFMSRYFLRDQEGEILNHGADILSGYLSDRQFVDGVTANRAERDLFTFQVFCTAIRAQFPDHCDPILQGFVRMIGFDALVGNQDRHFYNWGVITHPTGKTSPRFAPIYDSARGLFWNRTEDTLDGYSQPSSLASYVRKSHPLIGWDRWDYSKRPLNHFDLVECIALTDDTPYHGWLLRLVRQANASFRDVEGMIDAEFRGLLSELRCELIKRCLAARLAALRKIFGEP